MEAVRTDTQRTSGELENVARDVGEIKEKLEAHGITGEREPVMRS
jgi:hypothetical protein